MIKLFTIRKVFLFLLLPCLFTTCIPPGSLVALYVQRPGVFEEEVERFSRQLLRDLKLHAEQSRDFIVIDSIFSTPRFDDTVTHVVEIVIDSFYVIGFQAYSDTFRHVDKVSKIASKIYNPDMPDMFRPPIPAVISSIMFDVALDKMPKPKITGTARLVDIRDMQAQWTLDEPYELITTTPIPPKEQVSQLLAIMLNTIEDELDFFE